MEEHKHSNKPHEHQAKPENHQSLIEEEQVNANEEKAVPSMEDTLKKALAEEQEKSKANWDLALRARAEVDNIRRRAERDVENAHKFALEKMINELIPVLDSLERGLESAPEKDPMREGIVLTLKMFGDALRKFGVEIIDPRNHEAFDPVHHQAIAMTEHPDLKPGVIVHVAQRGYSLNGRLLRAARVVVVKASE